MTEESQAKNKSYVSDLESRHNQLTAALQKQSTDELKALEDTYKALLADLQK